MATRQRERAGVLTSSYAVDTNLLKASGFWRRDAMHVQPYLMFDGRCEEAYDFYHKAIGAEKTMLLRFSESPDPLPPGMVPAGSENKIMHMQFRIGDSIILASDGR